VEATPGGSRDCVRWIHQLLWLLRGQRAGAFRRSPAATELVPELIGTEQKRFFEFVGDRLILKTPPLTVLVETQVHRLVWERLM
jgi:hypothetical protein